LVVQKSFLIHHYKFIFIIQASSTFDYYFGFNSPVHQYLGQNWS